MIKYILTELIPDDLSRDDFALWAFGDGYCSFEHGMDFLHAWNELHGDAYRLRADSSLLEDLTEMVELWRSALGEL